jgi:diaminopimelate decarboxylase
MLIVSGMTCGSYDEVVVGYQLPDMIVGESLLFDDIGAYGAKT